MSLQVELASCPCRRCPWKFRGKCKHYAEVCLERGSCSRCGSSLGGCVREEVFV